MAKATVTRYFFIFFLVLTAYKSFSQRDIFNLYMYDMKLVNPAFAGTSEAQIFSTNFQTSLTNFEHNPYALYVGYENSLSKINSGVGSIISYNQEGSVSEFRADLLYDYQFEIGVQKKLSVGAAFGYERAVIDYDKFRAIHPEDPILHESATSSSANNLNFNLGALLLINNLKIGLSTYNLVESREEIAFIAQTDNSTINFFLENMFDLTEWLSFRPSVLYQSDFSSTETDLNAVFEIKKLILIGGNYQIRENVDNNLNLNGGVLIKDRAEIILLAYSKAYQKLRTSLDVGLNFEALVRLKFDK